MPWSETNVSKERVRFVLEWERRWKEGEGVVNMSELCREFGVSRECGYKWVRRYVDAGHDLAAAEERSRRPHHSPTAVADDIQDVIVAARKQKPKWGPVKLRSWLVERYPGVAFPSASAIAAILKRHGLVRLAKRRRRPGPVAGVSAPFADCDAPNRVWCVDFKGWFLTGDGVRCYPLTISDGYSRYVLRCEAMRDPDGTGVFAVFDSAFREFGLPDAIRSDGGPPFASTAAAGLTRLSVWWLQLGIRVERIAPGKPQQNGRHERMHRTLKLEVEPQADARAQQRAFDLWRREFNEERPHAALGHRPPNRIYQPSSRRQYPRPLLHPQPPAWNESGRLDKDGFLRFHRRKVFITSALSNLYVELELVAAGVYEVKWGKILLGRIDERSLDRGISPARRRRGQVSTMSLE
jgi:transposase InsO family protein